MVIFLQQKPSTMIKKFVGLSSNDGNTALVPPLWAFGPWNEFGGEFNDSNGSALIEIQRYISMDIPVSVHLGNLHFFPLGDEVGHEEYYEQLNQQINALGVQVLAYFNSMIDVNYTSDYKYALNHSYFVVNPTRNGSNGQYDPYLFQYKGAGPNPFYCGVLDLTEASAYEWFQQQMAKSVKMGFRGFMYDYGEYIDPKAFFQGNGKYGKEMHNRYPVVYQQCAHDYFISITNQSLVNGVNAPDFIFYARSGYVGKCFFF
ncbi:hypothetical protein RFI_09900 [Reticulomyxa filosa]|uniref:Glycoside hydrolase family 31 TIM barrel domain-containing protein n=1 Tax=Reticulomyxa filosa TaxID=46433 RepID=X6NLS1_RETFI|nr:hypothetical protein RFI_09900 [Reticulomyxa filosa]|eukprot:ETO27235.1 hypothetical protein RFI_09900 [Reticulomyxa filosa]